jgi:hypothetical protein
MNAVVDVGLEKAQPRHLKGTTTRKTSRKLLILYLLSDTPAGLVTHVEGVGTRTKTKERENGKPEDSGRECYTRPNLLLELSIEVRNQFLEKK